MRNDPGLDSGARSIARLKRLYDQAAGLAHLGAWECDLATERLMWTDGVYALFDLPIGVPLKRSAVVDLYVDESRRDMEFMRAEAIRTGQGFTLETQIRTSRGERRWMRLSLDVERDAGRAVRLFGAKQDMTAERATWDRLRRLADYDPLTGLANRRLFEARYRAVTADAACRETVAALVLIDLDHFKSINDGLGHAAGDACLREIAARLKRVFVGAVLVARLGGDEFAVLLRAPLGPARIARLLQRARAALGKPIPWNASRLDVGVSIGARIVAQPEGRRLSDMFADADAALYAAKAAGRNTVRIHRDDSAQRPLIDDVDPLAFLPPRRRRRAE